MHQQRVLFLIVLFSPSGDVQEVRFLSFVGFAFLEELLLSLYVETVLAVSGMIPLEIAAVSNYTAWFCSCPQF